MIWHLSWDHQIAFSMIRFPLQSCLCFAVASRVAHAPVAYLIMFMMIVGMHGHNVQPYP